MVLINRILLFALVPATYVLFDWLHWAQAGKVALLGAFALLAVSSWTTCDGNESKTGKILVLLTASCFFVAFGFHTFLHEFSGVTPDDNVVTAALFSTNQSEAGEFVRQQAWPLAKHIALILLSIAIFGCLVFRKSRRKKRGEGAPSPRAGRWKMATGFTIAFVLLHLNPSLRRQNPFLYFPVCYSAWKYQLETVRQLQTAMAATGSDAGLSSLSCKDNAPRTVVFVLGESITSADLSFTGYPRKTTPELDSMKDELIWFPDVVSSDPTTFPSLSKMLTPASLSQPDLWLVKPDVLTMARKVGYKTFWISNHSTDAGGDVSIFVSHADKAVLTNKGGSRGEGSYDEVVLPPLEEALRDPAPRKFIILHLLNAHPVYYFRYPASFARFNDSNDEVVKRLKAAGRAFWAIRMRNYYDNAVLYADHVLKRSLDLCRASGQRLAWIYVPDHGQDAAHNSNFSGHNARARTQYEIPIIFWRSPGFPKLTVDSTALRARPYQTDRLDDTLLGLLGISGDYYDHGDLFSDKFESVARTIDGRQYP